MPDLDETGVATLGQLEWGLERFFFDALLYYGDLRSAFRDLRVKAYTEISHQFAEKRFDSEALRARRRVLPFERIAVDDRYLISEVACKAYTPESAGGPIRVEQLLLDEYAKSGGGKTAISSLFNESSSIATTDRHAQFMLQLATEEYLDDIIETQDEIRERIGRVAARFTKAREAALRNTKLYLSIVNELDVYVATSMRRRSDFRNMANDCAYIFGHDNLKHLHLRYFDPTMSAAEGHEDKGLVECLMVKCGKVLLYFAGSSDSFGKDAEVAMAMSLGKPVIILCPSDSECLRRVNFFRDVHPLSRLIDFETGVADGAMVTQDRDVAVQLITRIFDNAMEYDLDHDGDAYYRLKERLTGSVVRLQTNTRMLRESFWNYYHGVP